MPLTKKGPSERDLHHLFRSSIFKRLFFSYVLIILIALIAYCVWYLQGYRTDYARNADMLWQRHADSFAMSADQQLLSAQAICTQINASEACRSFFRTVYIEQKSVDALQLYNMLGELSRIKGGGGNRNIYNICLAFQGDHRAYIAGSVVSLNDPATLLSDTPFFGMGSVASLLNLHAISHITLTKEFLIYADMYTGFGQQSSGKGSIMVLLDASVLTSAWRQNLPEDAGFTLARADRETPILAQGEGTDHAYTVRSAVLPALVYTVYAPDSAFRAPFLFHSLIPLFGAALVSLLFLLLTFYLSRTYYRPIDNIQQMIRGTDRLPDSPGILNASHEFDSILEGISDLIVERNGYQEKMVTITPYARQGMLQVMISGQAGAQASVLVNDHFTDLRRTYFAVGIVNLVISPGTDVPLSRYADARTLLREAISGLSGEEINVVTTPQGERSLCVIASADARENFEGFFHTLYRTAVDALDAAECQITVGVSDIESDIERLPIACRDAMQALGQILTGGRGAVYFFEPESSGAHSYSFPEDAQEKMDKALQKGDLQALDALLDDIYARNVTQADLPVSEIRQMADEVYWTIRKALRHTYANSAVHIQMEGIRDTATIDEIFDYYHSVFKTALTDVRPAALSQEPRDLESSVCTYIEEHIFSPDLSMNAVADAFGISPKMVGSICKKRYGQTFLNYVHDRQIHRAAELLENTDASLEQIATSCGFTNLLTFRRNFKAVMGVNPSDFRK